MENTNETPPRIHEDPAQGELLTQTDLHALIEEVRNTAAWQTGDRSTRMLYKPETMRIVLLALHQNAQLKTHTASGTISVQVLAGHIEFTANSKVVSLTAGHLLTLQKQIPHSVLALQDSFFLLTMVMG